VDKIRRRASKLDKARGMFQNALEFSGDEEQVETVQAVFNAFAKMETKLKDYEGVIYKVRKLFSLSF
jgi:crooked neck